MKSHPVLRQWRFFVLLAAGAAVLIQLLQEVGVEALGLHLARLGWLIPCLLLIALPIQLVNTAGLRYCIPRTVRRPGWLTLIVARMAGEAVNNTTPSAYLGGEPIKVKILRPDLGGVQATASVVLAKTIQTLTELVFIIVGGVFALKLLNVPDGFAAGMGIVIGMGIVVIAALTLQQQRGLFSALFQFLGRVAFLWRLVEDHMDNVRRLDERIASFYRESRRDFAISYGFHLLGWIMGAVECLLMLWALGAPVDFTTALVIEAVLLIAQGVLFFIPGSLGMTEGAAWYVASWAGLDESVGLMLGLLKRMRMALWSIAGWALLVWVLRVQKARETENGE